MKQTKREGDKNLEIRDERRGKRLPRLRLGLSQGDVKKMVSNWGENTGKINFFQVGGWGGKSKNCQTPLPPGVSQNRCFACQNSTVGKKDVLKNGTGTILVSKGT